jgi:3-deoxy-D-manno-octulosonic-acid transferase
VAALIGSRGHALLQRSSFQDLREITEQNALDRSRVSVFLGDSLGEMNFYYSSANVALLGGSFLPFGGQNLIESIACECPILMGPHTFNFKEVAHQASHMGAARQVLDVSAAVMHALSLVDQGVDLTEMKRLGQEFIHAHQGATELTYQAIEHLLVDEPSVVQPV